MQIGPYRLKNNLILAPMAGVTDLPFRVLCRQMGAGMAVSEMVASNSLLWGSKKTILRADHAGEPGPCSVQIMGSDAQMLADAAVFNVASGAQIIDINMGCPAKKVCNVAAGSALLKNELLVAEILHKVRAAVSVPITLKIRTGWDANNRNAVSIAKLAEDAGISALAIHGRTRADAYKGTAEYDTIAEVKQKVTIPVIANGDIDSLEKAEFVLNYTEANALMIGRAAQGKPWIFKEIDYYLRTGKKLAAPNVEEVRQILLKHIKNLYEFYGEDTGVKIARKHIAWYTRGLRDSTEFRRQIMQAQTVIDQYQKINNFLSANTLAA